MFRKVVKKDTKFLARIVTEDPKPCAFCHQKLDDEINFGKVYAIGDIQCHYFCALLSCCLVQKGSDDTGLFGFQYKDILAELERCKKHRCSYCGQGGANIGCCVTTCRKQFHLPCGKKKHAVSLFYGAFKSFCQLHSPKQKIPDHIMAHAKRRKQATMASKTGSCGKDEREIETSSMVCVICYEEVDGFPTLHTFWPPCCARDAWFHRTCLQRMALSAGMHYLKCPLCNDKEMFYEAVLDQGYYVPDRDAAWELEQNAFSEIYERNITCSSDECLCPMGKAHDAESGPWDMQACLLCGSAGRHAACAGRDGGGAAAGRDERYVCRACAPLAPPPVLAALARGIDAVVQEEQRRAGRARAGPAMPPRMSVRRTKPRPPLRNRAPCAKVDTPMVEASESANVKSSRLDLNLKPPRKHSPTKDSISPTKDQNPTNHENDQKDPFSPTKHENRLTFPFSSTKDENGLRKNPFSPTKDRNSVLKDRNNLFKDQFSPSKIIQSLEGSLFMGLNDEMVEKLRYKIMKPRPMCVKRKIVDETLQGLLSASPKLKGPVMEWYSPKKSECDEKKNLENESPSKGNVSAPEKIPTPDKENSIKNSPADEDDSSSTFQLPPEFVAQYDSDDSLHFEIPKRKTVEIKQDSSLEIFEKDHSISIDVVQLESAPNSQKSPPISSKNHKTDTIFKFSPLGKELVDVEDFKKEYLNEIGLSKVVENSKSPPKCFDVNLPNNETNFGHVQSTKKRKRHKSKVSKEKVREKSDSDKTSSNSNGDKKSAKRRMSDVPKERKNPKKRKLSENDLVLQYELTGGNKKNKQKKNKALRVTFDSNSKNKKAKLKTKLSVDNKNIKLKIKWKKEQFHLKLESKSKKNKQKSQKSTSNMKQYILQYPTEGKSNGVLVKPEKDVSPLKNKHIKLEKSPDKFKQTSLHSFFKIKSPDDK